MQSVDALRSVAALGVVLYHIVGRTPHGDMKNPFARFIESALLGVSSYGYVGVFLFFVISSFCIICNTQNESRKATRAQLISNHFGIGGCEDFIRRI